MKNNLKIFTALTIALIGASLLVPMIYAQVEIETATSSAVSPAVIEDNIKRRIQQVLDKSQVETVSNQIMAYVGLLESVTNQNLTMTINGRSEFVAISSETLVRDLDDESVNLEELEIGGTVVAIGAYDTQQLLQAGQIISLEEAPKRSDKKTVLGKIVDIKTRTRQVEVVTAPDQDLLILDILRSAVMIDLTDNRAELALADLNTQDDILVIIQPDTTKNNLIQMYRTAVASDSATPN